MAFIIETPNPFDPLRDIRKHHFVGGITIRQWLEFTHPGFVEFDRPTICVCNGEALKRAEWGRVIQCNDIISFVGMPQGPAFLVVAIVIAVALAVATLLIPVDTPKTPGQTPASDPVFTTKGQQNAIRLGEPIECHYGRNRIYPSYAARPYFQYINNDQFQYSLFCIGQGEYTIHEIQIGDTDIDSYQEVEYEVVPPGVDLALFPANVYSAPEAGGQELLAPNQDEYVVPGWVGPFPANAPNTLARQIQIDLTFPKGVYKVASSGKLANLSITVQAEYREIDDAGAPLSAFSVLFNNTYTWKTTTPQRISIHTDVSPARYEVRLRRTSNKDESHRAGHDVLWEALRSTIEIEQDFGNVTLLAVRIRATNNLNDRTQQQFNIIATRKIPIWESPGFTAPTESRSIVWALVDAFRSEYGGRITLDNYYDMDALVALDALYTSRNEFFDWSFRDPITVWEAAQAVARVGRAVPLLSGSLITMKRDGPQSIPVAMFGPDNIIEGTFDYSIKLWDIDEFDSMSVEYTDPDTGYKQEQVLCVLPGDTENTPEDVRLPGCQNRTHAYRAGLYMLASKRYLRENISFETGLEGHIPTYGDLVAISHDTPQWGQSGYIVDAVAGASANYHLYVSEPLDWTETGTHQIMLRSRTADLLGPFDAFQTEDPKQVIINMPTDSDTESGGFDFLLDGTTEPMLFLFGLAGSITKYARIVRLEPAGGERIRVTAVNDSSLVHSFDSLTPAALAGSPLIYPPDLPEIDIIYITQVDGVLQVVQVAWVAAFGAQYYVFQYSYDEGETWSVPAQTTQTAIQLQVNPGPFTIRVAAVNVGQGPWTEASIAIGLINGLENHIPWEDLEWGVRWWQVLNALGYEVKVYDNSTTVPTLIRTDTLDPGTLDYTYTYEMASESDGVFTRDMLVTVDVLVEGPSGPVAEGNPAELELHNDIPSPPTSPASVLGDIDAGVSASYALSWVVPNELDLIRVTVWVEAVSGFDPSVETPVFDQILPAPNPANLDELFIVEIPVDSNDEHPTHYWRVAVRDVWSQEIDTNITDEQVIPALT